MKIAFTPPPNYEKILRHFKPPTNAVFTYGDTCHAPDGRRLAQDVAEHELVHVGQQGDDPEAWWDRYFVDPAFRVEQELEAYRTQYKFAATHLLDRNAFFNYARSLAAELAGPMYGNVLTFSEALKRIRA